LSRDRQDLLSRRVSLHQWRTAARRLPRKHQRPRSLDPYSGAQPLGGGPRGSTPFAGLGPAACRCLVAAMSSERGHAGWPDFQGIPPPLVPSPGPPAPAGGHPSPIPRWPPCRTAPSGPPVSGVRGAVGPQGAVRGFHTNLDLLENCPQTALKVDQGPSSLHLTFPLPRLSPVLREALPLPLLEGLGYFSPEVKHRQGLRTPVSVFSCGWPFRQWGLRPPSPAHRTGVGWAGPRPLLTPHSPLGTGVQPGHIPHHS